MRIIFHWLILTGAIMAAAYVIPGIAVSNFLTALIAGACLGFINLVIKPVLKLLTLPINILTLGIFSIVLNALLFWALTIVVSGFTVATFKAALLGSLLVAVINWLFSKIVKED